MTDLVRVEVEVNGVRRDGLVEPRVTLADFLRDVLGLKGTHVACEHGFCGNCNVLLDGETVRSCLLFAVQADGGRGGVILEVYAPAPVPPRPGDPGRPAVDRGGTSRPVRRTPKSAGRSRPASPWSRTRSRIRSPTALR